MDFASGARYGRRAIAPVAAAFAWAVAGGAAAVEADPIADLGRLSIDELAQLEVSSVAKRAEPLSGAAAAVYVINADALSRSAAGSLPEALRLAPQLEITRIDALDYSITARGFGGFQSANKLLVLIDGRSVYTPLFSGVDWDQHHVLLEDVDRIEVVGGPGGTLWGANAVNGVISVRSKSAYDTQGWMVRARGGDQDDDVAVRYGGEFGSGAFRAYATAFRRADLETAAGADAGDGWDSVQGGFRYDWAGDRNAFTLQGDAHDGGIDRSAGLEGFVRGQNLLGRWTRRLGQTSSVEVQAYFDHFAREARLIHDELTTWDVQAQANFDWRAHQVVVGGGVRRQEDDFRTLSEPQLLSPPERTTTIGNVFVQDDVQLRPDLTLTLGLKLETNSYTRAEWMPNLRLAWRVNERQLLWGAVSRAIRNPSRIERDFQIPGLVEPGHMGSEKVIAYELGYRGRITDRANVSVNLFYNDYDELRTNNLTPPGVPPIFVGNTMAGETYGVEAWADVDLASWWRLSLGGTRLERNFRTTGGTTDLAAFRSAGEDPPYWLKARSSIQLSEAVSLDVALRRYGEIPDAPSAELVGVAAYTEAEVRLGWRVREDLELWVEGGNLLHERHAEAIENRRSEIPRSISVGLRWTR